MPHKVVAGTTKTNRGDCRTLAHRMPKLSGRGKPEAAAAGRAEWMFHDASRD